jgi:hypothetical protein
MRAIKSAYYPRAIRIRKEQYLEIYPQCHVGRSYPVVFGKKSGVATVLSEVADYIVNNYPGVSYVIDDTGEPEAVIPKWETVKPLAEMSWDDLRICAKDHGINCARKSRSVLEAEIAEVVNDERPGS